MKAWFNFLLMDYLTFIYNDNFVPLFWFFLKQSFFKNSHFYEVFLEFLTICMASDYPKELGFICKPNSLFTFDLPYFTALPILFI